MGAAASNVHRERRQSAHHRNKPRGMRRTSVDVNANGTKLKKDLEVALRRVTELAKAGSSASSRADDLLVENTKLHATINELQQQIDKLRCLAEQHRIGGHKDLNLTCQEDNIDIKQFLENATPVMPCASDTLRSKKCLLSPIVEEAVGPSHTSNSKNSDASELMVPQSSHHRIGVSAPPIHIVDESTKDAQAEEKDQETFNRIMEALAGNPFTSKFGTRQQQALAQAMIHRDVVAGEVVIQQGEEGDSLFVTESGSYELSQSGSTKGGPRAPVIGPNQVIGEMAILYKCTRTATIKALEPGRLWCIDLTMFHVVLYKVAFELQNERKLFLSSIPLFDGLAASYLSKLISAATERVYTGGDIIIDSDAAVCANLHFNLIVSGQVSVLIPNQAGHTIARTLSSGDYFGETALLGTLNASFQALTSRVEVLQIDRLAFDELIVPLEAIGKELGSLAFELKNADSTGTVLPVSCANLKLHQLDRLAMLGSGGFGVVELVALPDGEQAALKMIAKEHIIANAQQEHVISEKNVLQSLNSRFCLSLLSTFKDDRYCYLLTEACLGGELWSTLKRHGKLSEAATQYYTASVIEAIGYLHSHGIIYRDMKPENVLLTSTGHAKLADFGFAKSLTTDEKTWTFCGTPDYMPPEIVMNQGHDFAADLWPIGVLIFELLSGSPPFYSIDSMSTYNRIIVGIASVQFPQHFKEHAIDIVKAFCRECGSERLGNLHDGFAGIWAHPWFRGFDWQALRAGTMNTPLIPPNTIEFYPTGSNQDASRYTAASVGVCLWDEEF